MNPEYRKTQNEMLKSFTEYDSELTKLAHYVIHKYEKEVIENQKRKVQQKKQLYGRLRNRFFNFKNNTLIVCQQEKDFKLDDIANNFNLYSLY